MPTVLRADQVKEPLPILDLAPLLFVPPRDMLPCCKTHAVPPKFVDGSTTEAPRRAAEEILAAGDRLTSFQVFSIASALQAWAYMRAGHED